MLRVAQAISILPDPSLAASTMRADPGSPSPPPPAQEEGEEDNDDGDDGDEEEQQNEEEQQEGSLEDADAQQSPEPQQLPRTSAASGEDTPDSPSPVRVCTNSKPSLQAIHCCRLLYSVVGRYLQPQQDQIQ